MRTGAVPGHQGSLPAACISLPFMSICTFTVLCWCPCLLSLRVCRLLLELYRTKVEPDLSDCRYSALPAYYNLLSVSPTAPHDLPHRHPPRPVSGFISCSLLTVPAHRPPCCILSSRAPSHLWILLYLFSLLAVSFPQRSFPTYLLPPPLPPSRPHTNISFSIRATACSLLKSPTRSLSTPDLS